MLLVGCQGDENQVFMPEVVSDVNATAVVFVPAVQSGSAEETAEIDAGLKLDERDGEVDQTPLADGEPRTADADVIFVEARITENNNWTFTVTVSHPDLGWEDYADGWDVVSEDGSVVKPDPESPFTRLLLHPHENEQPFTRSQSGIEIPEDVHVVTVRAHDIVDGFGGQEIRIELSKNSGPGFEIHR